jgi:Domain of unknown function (DUF4136)
MFVPNSSLVKRSKILKHIRTIALFCAVLFAFPAFAQTVKVNWKQGASFSSYKTYAWKITPTQSKSIYLQWVQADVNAQLTAKGLTLATGSQKPDIYVAYKIANQEMLDATTTDDGFSGWGWGGGPWGVYGGWGGWGVGIPDIATTTEEPRTMGIMTVDLYDVGHSQLVWRGQATVDSVSNTQSGDEKQVKNSVVKMFKKYPPKP